MIKAWISLLSLIGTALLCPPSVLNDAIVADLMNLVPSTPGQTSFAYPFSSPFGSVPQTVVGICSLQISAGATGFMTYAVAHASATVLQVRSSPVSSHWQIRQIAVLATTHPQLLLDTVSGQLLSNSPVPSQVDLIFKLNLPNNLPTQQPIIVRTYLAGLSSSSPLSFLQIGSSTLSRDQLTVICLTKSRASAQLWVSMVAFPLRSASFAAYGGLATIEAAGTRFQDLFQAFAAPQKRFFGISAFSLAADTSSQSTEVGASIDDNFILMMNLRGQASSFQLSYLFLGVLPYTTCSACSAKGEGSIYSEGRCVTQCPAQRLKVSYGSGEVCRACPSVMGLGYQDGTCIECPMGTIASNGICMPNQPVTSTMGGLGLTNKQINQIFQGQASGTINTNQAYSGSIYIPSHSSQCPLPYMYFNGQECLCMVGFTMVSSICIQIPVETTAIVPIINENNNSATNNPGSGTSTVSQCSQPNQYYNGQQCVCASGYFMLNGNCTSCPANSQWNGQFCACNQGFTQRDGSCVSTQISSCPENSINNGLGVCICTQPNYQLINNTCQPISCPTSQRWNGTACVCPDNFVTNPSGSCTPRCANGSLWLANNQSCLVICGINSAFDAVQQRCVCIPGFGVGVGGVCQQCSNNHYVLNGYCVTCPANSIQAPQGLCKCKEGYALNFDGTCSPKCEGLEFYDPQTNRCDCLRGLGRINRVCTVCPPSTFLVGQTCSNCPANSVFSGGRCLCNSGYILNPESQSCVICMSLTNTFMLNGFCATCPSNQVYNSQTGLCGCETGYRLEGSRCIQSCQADELLDASGACYSCPANMVVSNNRCTCMAGYTESITGCGCVVSCSAGQFIHMGRCALCPQGMIYSSIIRGCICPDGFYWSSVNNFCQKGQTIPLSCQIGYFYQNNTQQCQACSSNCYNCTANGCVQCFTGYQLTPNAMCQHTCGDGIIVPNEQCDSGSSNSQGCINCMISTGYACTGQPSVCSLVSTPQPPPVVVNSSLTLQGNVSINTNNIYATLRTTPTFTFPNQNEMSQFMQISFPNSVKPTYYCQQRLPPNLDIFDCLLIYPSGVPNARFTINFSYNYQGRAASTAVTVDPLNSMLTAQTRARPRV